MSSDEEIIPTAPSCTLWIYCKIVFIPFYSCLLIRDKMKTSIQYCIHPLINHIGVWCLIFHWEFHLDMKANALPRLTLQIFVLLLFSNGDQKYICIMIVTDDSLLQKEHGSVFNAYHLIWKGTRTTVCIVVGGFKAVSSEELWKWKKYTPTPQCSYNICQQGLGLLSYGILSSF